MRRMLASMSIFSVLGLWTAGAQSPAKPEGARAQTSILKVSGMACGACARTVETVLKKVQGVKATVVSQPKGAPEIAFDPSQTTIETLAKVINAKTSFKAELEPILEKKQ